MSERPATDTVGRFGGLADTYDKHRPSYPAAAIGAVLAGVATPARVVDVGAGTGIASRLLARAGATVIAVEPNAEMRALAAASGIDARDGTAAATGLPAGSADVVSAFQAFHWFANPDALAEFRRVLRPGGRLALVWNERDRSDPFTADLRELEERHSDPAMLAGADFADDRLAPLVTGAGFANFRLATFPNEQRLDEDGLLGRVRSSSYVPREGPSRDAFLDEVRRAFARHRDPDGIVVMRYRTEVYLADAPA